MKMYRSLNPATGELIKEFDCFSAVEVEGALRNAAAANKLWGATSIEERRERVLALSNIILNNVDAFAKSTSLEMGKPIKQAKGEVEKCAWLCEHTANNAAKYLAEIEKDFGNYKAKVVMQPIGTVLGVMPWNYPYWQVYRYAIPALMAGNTVLLKHAPNIPQCALNIEKSFEEAGFPKGCFQNLFINNEQVSQLIADDRVNAVTFTGSVRGGSAIGEQASKHIKKSVLELGGSDPFIVLKDADIDKAASMAVKGRFNNAGQVCIAAKRWIVEAEVYDSFVEKAKAAMSQIKVGNPLEAETDMGPLARIDIKEGVEKQVKASVEAGAKMLYRQTEGSFDENFYPPTLLANISKGMPVYDDEVFGPVACVIKADDVDEAINIANDTPYGLGASIFTKNADLAMEIAEKIETGNVAINGLVSSHPDLPFGGVKKSGYGRELGLFGIQEFLNIKTITIR